MTVDIVSLIVGLSAALLSFIAAIAVAVINSRSQTKQFLAELDKQNALVVYRLEQLEDRVSAQSRSDHEARIISLEEQMKSIISHFGGFSK